MGNTLSGLILLLISAVVYWQAQMLPKDQMGPLGSGSLPSLIALSLALLSLVLLVQGLLEWKRSGRKAIDAKKLIPPLILIISFLAAIFLMNYIGFIAAILLFLIFAQNYLGPRSIRSVIVSIIISCSLTLGLFFFFRYYFNIHFPTGKLVEYLIY